MLGVGRTVFEEGSVTFVCVQIPHFHRIGTTFSKRHTDSFVNLLSDLSAVRLYLSCSAVEKKEMVYSKVRAEAEGRKGPRAPPFNTFNLRKTCFHCEPGSFPSHNRPRGKALMKIAGTRSLQS